MKGRYKMTENIYATWEQPQGYTVETDYDYDLHCFKLYSSEDTLLATSYPMDTEQMNTNRKALNDGGNMMDWDNLAYPES